MRPATGRLATVAVLDSYGRRCAITNEKTLPALDAAHIRAYRDVQEHSLTNGILFRADVHNLSFESGCTVGTIRSEDGTIVRDERYTVGARITLERTATRFAITCGVYGWMFIRASSLMKAMPSPRTTR